MNTSTRIVFVMLVCLASSAFAQTAAPRSKSRAAATSVSGLSFGGAIGFPMVVSASDYMYNYEDFSPSGLGLRYGITVVGRMRVGGLDRSNPQFALITEAKYTSFWHTTKATPAQPSASARFGMLSVSAGVEQGLGAGRTRPYFGLTIDVNAIEPGTLQTTTLDSTGYHTTTLNLTGDQWQLRLGVTPRLGLRTTITRSLTFDATIGYQIVNIVNRADYTPKNYLLDEFGKEMLLSNVSLSLGIMYALPGRKM